jgi:hypothetical protein
VEDKASPVAAIPAHRDSEGQASQLPGENDLAAGRIGAVMSFRAGGASPAPDTQSRHAEAEAKAITRTAGKAAIQRSFVTARELAEGLEPESRTERSTGGPKGADTPEIAPDDGMEM